MSRVTSKLQVTIPKKIAERHGIRPGSEIDWQDAGETIRVVPAGRPAKSSSHDHALALFDQATRRQERRNAAWKGARAGRSRDRGWRREDLYARGVPR
jgi:AbrB family looped-hinge helix DNA binding protein